MTKRRKANSRDGWAVMLMKIDSEIADLKERREEIVKDIEEWRADCAKWATKPEEIDPLFCSREEPCEQTVTMMTIEEQVAKAIQEQRDNEINTLFCSRDEGDCEPVTWTVALKAKNKVSVKVEEPTSVSRYEQIKKYINSRWQQVRTSFGM